MCPLKFHAAADCVFEMRADASCIRSSVKSDNTDFCMDFYLAHKNSQQCSFAPCEDMSPCNEIQSIHKDPHLANVFPVTLFCLFLEYQMSHSQGISMTGNQHTGHVCASTVVLQAVCVRYCLFGLLMVHWVLMGFCLLSFLTLTVMNGTMIFFFLEINVNLFLTLPQDTGIVTTATLLFIL